MREYCPLCNKEMKYYAGNELEPYEYHCPYCGFDYQEHVKHPMEEIAKRYKKHLFKNYLGFTKVIERIIKNER